MPDSLQDAHAPNNICFGCGPANPVGLQIKSYPEGDEVTAEFMPEEHHQAFPGVINGGIIGTLLDCHMNWTAAYALMKEREAERVPPTVTAEFTVKLRKPTPAGVALRLRARVVEMAGARAQVEATVEADGQVTAEGSGTFVAVGDDHAAAHRW